MSLDEGFEAAEVGVGRRYHLWIGKGTEQRLEQRYSMNESRRWIRRCKDRVEDCRKIEGVDWRCKRGGNYGARLWKSSLMVSGQRSVQYVG